MKVSAICLTKTVLDNYNKVFPTRKLSQMSVAVDYCFTLQTALFNSSWGVLNLFQGLFQILDQVLHILNTNTVGRNRNDKVYVLVKKYHEYNTQTL